MQRLEGIATWVVIATFTAWLGATALVAGPQHPGNAAAPTGMTAALPIHVILIMQDAKALEQEHARVGLR